MGSHSVSKGTRSREEGDTPWSSVQLTTERRGLGASPVLWDSVCNEEHPPAQDHQLRKIWTGSTMSVIPIQEDPMWTSYGPMPDLSMSDPVGLMLETPQVNKVKEDSCLN